MITKNTSTWLDTLKNPKQYPSLQENISVDVAIIGGGLTGISTAYELSKEKKSIAVIEKGNVDSSTTAYTTAFLSQVIDTDLQELVNMYGRKEATLVWQSHIDAINRVASIVKKEKINCEFMYCNDYSVGFSKDDVKYLQEEEKTAKKLGFDVKFETSDILGFTNTGFLTIPKQAKFHPLYYLQGLKEACIKNGVQIYENTEALKINSDKTLTIETPNGIVTAKHIVIATYDPFNHPIILFGRRGMYTSYVLEAEIEKNILHEGLYEDQENPYHYWRVDKGEKHDTIIVGGEDHRHELPMNKEKNYKILEKFLQKLLGENKYTTVRKWDGGILEPSDGLASIGKFVSNKNIYVAMAFSGNGMTYSSIAADLLTDLICGRKNRYEKIYYPNRIPPFKALMQKGTDYMGEAIGGALKNSLTII